MNEEFKACDITNDQLLELVSKCPGPLWVDTDEECRCHSVDIHPKFGVVFLVPSSEYEKIIQITNSFPTVVKELLMHRLNEEFHATANNFIQKVISNSLLSFDEAIDVVIEYFEDLLNKGDFKTCDATLKVAAKNLNLLDVSVSLSFLSMTFAAKERLPEWHNFYLQLSNFLENEEHLSKDQIKDMLRGLE